MSFGVRAEDFERIELTEPDRNLRLVELVEKFEISQGTASAARRRGYFYKRRGPADRLRAIELHYRILVLDGEAAWHWERLRDAIEGRIEIEEVFPEPHEIGIEPWILRINAKIIEIAQRRAEARRNAQNKNRKILDAIFWIED